MPKSHLVMGVRYEEPPALPEGAIRYARDAAGNEIRFAGANRAERRSGFKHEAQLQQRFIEETEKRRRSRLTRSDRGYFARERARRARQRKRRGGWPKGLFAGPFEGGHGTWTSEFADVRGEMMSIPLNRSGNGAE